MMDTNYIIALVKILEIPKKIFLNNTTMLTKCRAQLANSKNTQIINLIFWDNLGVNLLDFSKINSYILLEGYLSFRTEELADYSEIKSAKKTVISVIKVYNFS